MYYGNTFDGGNTGGRNTRTPSRVLQFGFTGFHFLTKGQGADYEDCLRLGMTFFYKYYSGVGERRLLGFCGKLYMGFFRCREPPFDLLVQRDQDPTSFVLGLGWTPEMTIYNSTWVAYSAPSFSAVVCTQTRARRTIILEMETG